MVVCSISSMEREMKENKPVKQNVNFLDRALFMPSRKLARRSVYTDDNGFHIRSTDGYSLPTAYDMAFMLFLLSRAQKKDSTVIRFNSMYEMMKEFGMTFGSNNIERVRSSLWKWYYTSMKFDKGTFYDAYTRTHNDCCLAFHVISNLRISENGIRISIDGDFYRESITKYSRLFKNLDTIKRLAEFPYALRLFFILSKSFHGRDEWCIKLINLLDKMGIEYNPRFNSRVMEQLDKAIKRLNGEKETIIYDLNKKTGVLIFKKLLLKGNM
jgi:hypothetical protein